MATFVTSSRIRCSASTLLLAALSCFFSPSLSFANTSLDRLATSQLLETVLLNTQPQIKNLPPKRAHQMVASAVAELQTPLARVMDVVGGNARLEKAFFALLGELTTLPAPTTRATLADNYRPSYNSFVHELRLVVLEQEQREKILRDVGEMVEYFELLAISRAQQAKKARSIFTWRNAGIVAVLAAVAVLFTMLAKGRQSGGSKPGSASGTTVTNIKAPKSPTSASGSSTAASPAPAPAAPDHSGTSNGTTAVALPLPASPAPAPSSSAVVAVSGATTTTSPPSSPLASTAASRITNAVNVASPDTLQRTVGAHLGAARTAAADAAVSDAARAKADAIELLTAHSGAPICTLADTSDPSTHTYHIVIDREAWNAILQLAQHKKKLSGNTKKTIELCMLRQALPPYPTNGTYTASFSDNDEAYKAAQDLHDRFFAHRGHTEKPAEMLRKAREDLTSQFSRTSRGTSVYDLSKEDINFVLTHVFKGTTAAVTPVTE